MIKFFDIKRFVVVLLALLVLWPAAAPASSDRDLRWYAGLYPQNREWIMVQVDTRAIEANALVKNVRFAVAFYDGTQDLLGGSRLEFTAGAAEALKAGRVYQRFFPNPFRAAARAEGMSLRSSLGAGGLQFATLPLKSRSGAVIFAFEGGQGASPTIAPPTETIQLGSTPAGSSMMVFQLPADAVANNNGTIGPFCCTGRTATVSNAAGEAVGHIYFYDFNGARTIEGNSDSAAETVSILLSASLPHPFSLVRGAARFKAASWQKGAQQTIILGKLTYTVTFDAEVLTLGSRRAFRMSSIRARVEVNELP